MGLFTIDNPGECCDSDKVQERGDAACRVLPDMISNRALQLCIKNNCESGSVACDHSKSCHENSKALGYATGFVSWYFTLKGTANICVDKVDEQRVGLVIIHEFAHVCTWPSEHPQKWKHARLASEPGEEHERTGVPGPEGEIRPRPNNPGPICTTCPIIK